ncbi:GNAT family N-acetyltransferase [Bradyrhizobium sp. AUGA SZCCT0431]|uniref:GNAT family N-acetyltransferase n=1 Tax=Bradyrhizobium sp. AUGA SZCCT0431 TaxID=2807674 RepID=UPI001BAC984D|nr:GNAT family N-acetyltransferase [Bradyrhizobium sp. AUGA SZCCT0431]MBR1145673.1 GNAT family N-acetyltransferase [Bradyrhizobium sp. AUGA SZCCT0431]
MLALRPARPDEAPALTELCLRSKAVWGYDAAFMQACRRELMMTPAVIMSSRVQVAEVDGRLAGVAEVKSEGDVAQLERLFVEPGMLRAGTGRQLLDWAKATARAAGATTMLIDADPDAAPFYRRMGAVDDGVVPSGSIPGRFIPRLNLSL